MMRPVLIASSFVVLCGFMPHQKNSGAFSSSPAPEYDGVCADATELTALPEGTWCTLPNSTLSTVKPDPAAPGYTEPDATVIAYSGAAFDEGSNTFYWHGGGHADGADNSIYGYDFDTLTISRLWGPTPNASIDWPAYDPPQRTYNNGDPVAYHTYNGLAVRDGVFWRYCGSPYSQPGTLKDWVDSFNFTSGEWTQRTDAWGGTTCIGNVVYDPVLDVNFLMRSSVSPKRHNLDTDTYTPVGPSVNPALFYETMTPTYDAARRMFVLAGNDAVIEVDPDTGIITADATTNCAVPALGEGVEKSPGVAYDPVSTNTIMYEGGGASRVWSYDPDTNTCTEVAAAAGNLTTPYNETNLTGIYGRWRYVPSFGVFALSVSINHPLYAYRPFAP